MEAFIGYGRVAVSDSLVLVTPGSALGLGSGGGREKSLEVLRRFAVGDNLFIDIVCNSVNTIELQRNLERTTAVRKALGFEWHVAGSTATGPKINPAVSLSAGVAFTDSSPLTLID